METKYRTGYNYWGSLLAGTGLLFFLLFFSTIVGLDDVGMGKALENPVVVIPLLVLLIAGPIAATIYFRKVQQPETQEYINRAAVRYVIAMLMFFYGFAKIHQKFFEITYAAQDTKLADLDSFYLVWYFFGRSNVQEIIIGFLEFLPAVLLLFRRTSFIATLVLLPIELNVMMVNIFNHVSPITFILSIYISLGGIYLLYGWKDVILKFFRSVVEMPRPSLPKPLRIFRGVLKIWILGAISLILVGAILSAFRNGDKRIYAYRNKFTGGFELNELKVNGTIIIPGTGDTQHYKSIYIEPQNRWNSVLTFTPAFQSKAITIQWNAANDSVQTFLKKAKDVANNKVDTSTKFTGTYTLKKDTLYINGMQYGNMITAKYYKKKLRDYNWFW